MLDVAKILQQLKSIMPETAEKPLDELMNIAQGPDSADGPPEGSPEEEAQESPGEEADEQAAGQEDEEDEGEAPMSKPGFGPPKKKFKL